MPLKTTLINALLLPVIASLAATFIDHLLLYEPLYMNINYIFIILILAILSKVLSYDIFEKSFPVIKKISTVLRSKVNIQKALLLFGVIVLVCLITFHYLFPPFEITEPKEGNYVDSTSTIYGHGAIPGSLVRLFVIDRYGQHWSQGTVISTDSGLWVFNGVHFGQSGSEYFGQDFKIFADLTKDGRSYETQQIDVVRSNL